MHHLIPIETFECSDLPVLATDQGGVVRYCNQAGSDFFDRGSGEVLGQTCWKVARFRSPDGLELCRPGCAILKAACEGPILHMQPAILPVRSGSPLRFNLWTFVCPPGPCRTCTLLHFFIPALEKTDHPVAPATEPSRGGTIRLHMLTRREMETLALLAAGLAPVDAAERMGVSLTTVRNHIRRMLRKLRLHRQVDAIMALLEMHGGPFPSQKLFVILATSLASDVGELLTSAVTELF